MGNQSFYGQTVAAAGGIAPGAGVGRVRAPGGWRVRKAEKLEGGRG